MDSTSTFSFSSTDPSLVKCEASEHSELMNGSDGPVAQKNRLQSAKNEVQEEEENESSKSSEDDFNVYPYLQRLLNDLVANGLPKSFINGLGMGAFNHLTKKYKIFGDENRQVWNIAKRSFILSLQGFEATPQWILDCDDKMAKFTKVAAMMVAVYQSKSNLARCSAPRGRGRCCSRGRICIPRSRPVDTTRRLTNENDTLKRHIQQKNDELEKEKKNREMAEKKLQEIEQGRHIVYKVIKTEPGVQHLDKLLDQLDRSNKDAEAILAREREAQQRAADLQESLNKERQENMTAMTVLVAKEKEVAALKRQLQETRSRGSWQPAIITIDD